MWYTFGVLPLLLIACATDPAPPAAVPPTPPAASPAVAPTASSTPLTDTQPREAVQPCRLVFTPYEANQAFALLSGRDTTCAFEGVKVEGSLMRLRWKPTPLSEVAFVLQPESCGEEEAWARGDGMTIVADDATRAACPKAAAMIGKLLEDGSFPDPIPAS